jgi:cytosine/adenosine deaminase-related metal-dependent hydrolase
MSETARLARSSGVSLHTHLAENDDDVRYSLSKFGKTPAQYAEDLGWTGPDVWHAHCVKLDDDGISRFARTGTGVAHCPCSNMRLASGIAPVRRMLDRGVTVGLGVDGSASNDGAHMLGEARQAMLLQRVGFGPAALSARQSLRLATRGGAAVLNRKDIGHLTPGMVADIVGFDLRGLNHAGALHDPLAALLFAAPSIVSFNMVNGRFVVRDGELLTADVPSLVTRHNDLAATLLAG